MNLAFTWKHFRPITKGLYTDSEENVDKVKDDSLASILFPSENSPFSIHPSCGNILARKTSTFVIRFLPEKVSVHIILYVCTMSISMLMAKLIGQLTVTVLVADLHNNWCVNVLFFQLGSFVDMGHLTLTGKVKLNSLNSSAEGIEWIQLPDSTISISCLQFLGTCEVIMFMYI